MSSRTSRFLSTKVAKRTWHLSLIKNPLQARIKMISRMCTHMNLLKVNTFISMRICAGWSMHLLSSKLNCFSSSGWMFLLMCLQKMTNSSGCLQQRRGSDCTAPAQSDAFLYPARHVYSFWHANSWLQNISLIVFNHFRPPYQVVTSENLLKIFDLVNCR